MAIALITGGGSGIGAAVGTLLARNGDTVILADIDTEAADTVPPDRGLWWSRGVRDVGRARHGCSLARLVDRVVSEHGRIDLIFNNAGIGVGGPIEELTEEHWQRIADVNIMGVVHGVRAAYPHMLAQGDGHIVNTASLAGLIPSPMLAPYAMTKHAVVGLSLSLRSEAALHGVRVSALCPGATETPILDSTGPADLAPAHGVSARELLTKASGGNIYPGREARPGLRARGAREQSTDSGPASARITWRLNRLLPGQVGEGRFPPGFLGQAGSGTSGADGLRLTHPALRALGCFRDDPPGSPRRPA